MSVFTYYHFFFLRFLEWVHCRTQRSFADLQFSVLPFYAEILVIKAQSRNVKQKLNISAEEMYSALGRRCVASVGRS